MFGLSSNVWIAILSFILMCTAAYAVYQYTQQEDFAACVKNKNVGEQCNSSCQCKNNASCNNGKCEAAGTGLATNKTFVASQSSQQSINDCGRSCSKDDDCKQTVGCDKCRIDSRSNRGTCSQ